MACSTAHEGEPTPRTDLWRYAIPSSILLLALGLRLYRLGDANVMWDEALAVWAARKGLLGAALWTAADAHPPLYYWSLWGWMQAMGETEFAIRALFAFSGVLTVAVVYALGARVAGRRTGAVAALLTAVARFHVWWSQDVRMYGLAALLGTLSVYLFLRWLAAERGEASGARAVRVVALYALVTFGALFTLYPMALVPLVQNVVVALALCTRTFRRRRMIQRWILTQVAVLVPMAAWMAYAWGRIKTASVGEPVSLEFMARLYATLLSAGAPTDIDRYTWAALSLTAVLVLGIGVGLWRVWRRRGVDVLQALRGLTLAGVSVIPLPAFWLLTQPFSPFYSSGMEARYLLPFAPCAWVLLAWGLRQIRDWQRWVGYLALAGVTALLAFHLPAYYAGRRLTDGVQTMVREIISQASPEDVVLLDSGSRLPVFSYYYERVGAESGRPEVIPVSPARDALSVDELDGLLSGPVLSHGRYWLAEVEPGISDPQRLVRQWFDERFPRVLERAYGSNTLALYAPEGGAPQLRGSDYAPQHSLTAGTGGGLLLGWEVAVSEFAPGDTARVTLLWEQVPAEPSIVGLVSQSDARVVLSQQVASTEQEKRRQQFDLPIMHDLSAGVYEWVLNPASPDPVRLGSATIANSEAAFSATPAVGIEAALGPDILLEGYTVQAAGGGVLDAVYPGDAFLLDLTWRALGDVDADLTVFVHLLGEAYNPDTQGPVWGQHDARPVDNAYPTIQWRTGAIVYDRHTVVVDAGAPPGTYVLEVGMYDARSGQRLPVEVDGVSQEGDRLVLPTTVDVVPR